MGAKAAEQEGMGRYSEMQVVSKQPYSGAEKNAEMMGPDGTSAADSPSEAPSIEEIIVPGSEQVIPTPPGTELNSPMELLEPPTASINQPIRDGDASTFPWMEDKALLDIPSTDRQTQPDGTAIPTYAQQPISSTVSTEIQPITPESERPESRAALVPRDTATTYSLNDRSGESTEEYGDDAIEGIFGSIEMPDDISLAAPQTPVLAPNETNSQTSEATIETANVNEDDIPFKFE
jgi:hypothetical protein